MRSYGRDTRFSGLVMGVIIGTILIVGFQARGFQSTTGLKKCTLQHNYIVGTGIADITGPSADLALMGYSDPAQKAEGIWMRLWARAFIIENPCENRFVTMVIADLGLMFQSVHQEVLRRLEKIYGSYLFTAQNLMLSATHTHSGIAGYSHYTQYNLATIGYDEENFEAIVEGIVGAISQAYKNRTPARIFYREGLLRDTNHNRSPVAYNANPIEERQVYETEFHNNTNTRMTLLRFDSIKTKEPLGAIVWFAAHATSVSNKNRLVNGDHKGYASYIFEREIEGNKNRNNLLHGMGSNPFVAAFAQSDSGDVSPNQIIRGANGNTAKRPCDDSPSESCSDLDNAAIHGRKQYLFARALFDTATEEIQGPLDSRFSFVDMENIGVQPRFGDGQIRHTCRAALGVSILAGAEDGVVMSFIREGLVYGNNSPRITLVPKDQACHEEKTILLPIGRLWPYPWSPTILPLLLIRIGQLSITAGPFEITSMAASRLRQTIAQNLTERGITHIVVNSHSNAYSSYVTTREEYRLQHFEGTFTQFGPWTLAAYQQEFARLADLMARGEPVRESPSPLDLKAHQYIRTIKVVADSPCFDPTRVLCSKKAFGDLLLPPRLNYKPGEEVQVRFRGAHPRNDLRRGVGYLVVERKENDRWIPIAHDWDPETLFIWKRKGGPLSPRSEVEIRWRIPREQAQGYYRIQYFGSAKLLGKKNLFPFNGLTEAFEVRF